MMVTATVLTGPNEQNPKSRQKNKIVMASDLNMGSFG